MNSTGDRLREERERLGFNQTAMGAVGGVLKQAQLKYEKGERSPDASYLEGVAKVGVDVQYVITGQRSAQALSADEQELLALFRAASLAGKAAAIGALQGVAGASIKKQVNVSAPHGHAAGRDINVGVTKGSK